MSRRVWTGILAGVLAATVLLGVAGAAYRVGQSHEVVTRTVGVGDGTGEVVRVVGGYGPGWGYGHGGFFLFPLLLTILVVLLVVRATRGGWRGGYGPCGPRPEDRFEEQHRRAHDRAGAGPRDAAEV